INPRQPNEVVITAFSGSWGATAPLWLSRNGGNTWTKEFTINPPPGVGGVPGCPCDQTVHFGSVFNRLAGVPHVHAQQHLQRLHPDPGALPFLPISWELGASN